MLVIPAIDLKDGKVVRLIQGKAQEMTVYSDNPASIATEWVINGAQLLHIVDLDGALSGEQKNLSYIAEIVKKIEIPVQVGGGIRNISTIESMFNIGISKVVIGTRAIEDEAFLKEVIGRWRDRIIVSLDSSHGMVFKEGWTAPTMIKGIDLARKMQEIGVVNFIYTDIARDGTLKGPNTAGIRVLLNVIKGVNIVASGGISCFDDIKELKLLEENGLSGVIVGKALYERKMVLREAINYAS